jgi:integrase/recombinase XerC
MLLPIEKDLLNTKQVWVETLRNIRRYSPNTCAAYETDLLHFFKFYSGYIGEVVSFNHLNRMQLKEWRAWLASRNEHFDAKSNARALSTLRHFWRFLLKQGKITNDSIELVKNPRTKKSLPRALNYEQVFEVMEKIQDTAQEEWVGLRNKALFMLLYGAGLRISEALSLLQKDAKENLLIVRGKGGKERTIPMLSRVQDALTQYLEKCPYKGANLPLFMGSQGKVLNRRVSAQELLVFRRLYNLPETLTPHALRHTCATHLLKESGDLRGIQTLLGHASLRSTQIYTHIDTDQLMKAYSNFHPMGQNQDKDSQEKKRDKELEDE